MRSYDAAYLPNGRKRLGWAFHHGIVDMGMNADDFSWLFSRSELGRLFGRGDPRVIAGMSGTEIAKELLREYGIIPHEGPITEPDLWIGDIYWAGWAVAYYQWYTGRPFDRIFEKVPLSEIIGMYHPFHEMDITEFVSEMEMRTMEHPTQSRLRSLRESMGWSQSELSEASDVDIRSIRIFEGDPKEIDEAPAKTVYRLASALCCSIEDLLEDPTAG